MHMHSLKLLCPTVWEEMHLQENILFDPWPWCQDHTKCNPVPSTSFDLCSCKVWSCYVKWLRRRCIYKKIHYLTLGSRSHKMLPSKYPLHHVNYAATKFEVATSNRLGGDIFTRNVTDTQAQTDGRTTDRHWYEINIPFFSKEQSGYNNAWFSSLKHGLSPVKT